MQTNDLPLAQKLAALMEAGRAMHPEKHHIRGALAFGDGVCAMGYVMLGAGIPIGGVEPNTHTLAAALGVEENRELTELVRSVVRMNDQSRASIEEIIAAVRDGTLPEAPVVVHDFATFFASEIQKVFVSSHAMKSFQWIGFDEAAPEKISVAKVGASDPKPDKTVRTSAKTGASWPKPKHAFA